MGDGIIHTYWLATWKLVRMEGLSVNPNDVDSEEVGPEIEQASQRATTKSHPWGSIEMPSEEDDGTMQGEKLHSTTANIRQ